MRAQWAEAVASGQQPPRVLHEPRTSGRRGADFVGGLLVAPAFSLGRDGCEHWLFLQDADGRHVRGVRGHWPHRPGGAGGAQVHGPSRRALGVNRGGRGFLDPGWAGIPAPVQGDHGPVIPPQEGAGEDGGPVPHRRQRLHLPREPFLSQAHLCPGGRGWGVRPGHQWTQSGECRRP